MPKPKFEVPTIQSKTIAPSSLKIYKSKLNKLAEHNIQKISDILQNQDKVIEIAKKDTQNNPAKMRLFLSAVFYVLSDLPLESKLKLYNAFQDYKDEEYRKPL